MKRPAFQFYPADWRKDPALSVCSLTAKGLWIELMCVAHESDNYGHLSINGSPMTLQQIARTVGELPGTVSKLLAELESAGVFSRSDEGCIYSRRMVADEHIRNVRADAGRLGGNPNLVKQKDNGLVKQNKKQNLTPSSSSSSSSSKDISQPDGFEEFYRNYPKHVAKPMAAKSWKKEKAGECLPAILQDIQSRLDNGSWKLSELTYIPNPSTYINQRRWEDAPAAPLLVGGLLPGAI